MLKLLEIYSLSIVAGVLSASLLSLIGAQVAARRQELSALVLSQAMLFGLVATKVVMPSLHESGILDFVGSLVVGSILTFVAHTCSPKRADLEPVYYLGLYVLLLSATYVLSSLFPALESHVISNFFGDLALASQTECVVLIGVSIAALIFILKYWTQLTRDSFYGSIFQLKATGSESRLVFKVSMVLSFVAVALSINFFGLLFTLSALFLPTMFLSRANSSMRFYVVACVLFSALGVAAGFFASLLSEDFSAVPLIALSMGLSSLLGLLCFKCKRRV